MDLSQLKNNQATLVTDLEEFALEIGGLHDPTTLERLFRHFPYLVNHLYMRGPYWHHLAWDILQAREFDENTVKCIEVLNQFSLILDGSFVCRMLRDGDLELIKTFCRIFNIGPDTKIGDGSFLSYAISTADSVEEMSEGEIQFVLGMVDRTLSVDGTSATPNLPSLTGRSNILFCSVTDVFFEHYPDSLETLLKSQYKPGLKGMTNLPLVVSRFNEWLELPFTHYIAVLKEFTTRLGPNAIKVLDKYCDYSESDSLGRTAIEYAEEIRSRKEP